MADSRQVVVTGGGTGIGYAIASRFAKAGDEVTITGRRENVLTESAALLGARAVPFDASDPAAVEAALADLPDRVDVLVNNAGGNVEFGGGGSDLAALAGRWRANFAANVLSAVLVTTALKPRLADNARVITLGSIAANKGAGSYGAAKAAVESWTADISRELGPRGITANVVAPGLIGETEFFQGTLTGERRELLISQTRNKRAGTVEDVAELVGFLGSPDAGHLTGQVIHLNGGAHLAR
ncbi:SDR family NAD(P)-dependent oxidoreductase [Amycolatopsis alkalitolerans]|uniref:SDR family oxidoreductase n=1 Tax=Amycolatopsis alkalitolerans TaxID=2547244 RepID=A0A5C4M7V7_9PSEU|nr:SDR family oxidoreductase [Amycolatopsis alkalitolerans]TNC29547.1 SDR family oxidoreductase [Amycolatopsis alkalitolerans]